MEALKWNFTTRKYSPYTIPADWHCPIFGEDMDEKVNCASCGVKLLRGHTYTSRKIHTQTGFGYGVCHECYQGEEAEAKGADR